MKNNRFGLQYSILFLHSVQQVSVFAMGFILVTDVIRIFLRKNYKITFTSKVILTITGGLTLWSTLHLFFCEASFQHMLVGDKFLVSLFQAVSAMTTAGYNTVDVSLMASISMFILAMA